MMHRGASCHELDTLKAGLGGLCGPAVVQAPSRDFVGDLAVARIGGLNVARLTHNALQMERGVPPADAPASRKVLMIAQLQSSSLVSQDGTDIEMNRGDIVLVDSNRPYKGRFSGLTSLFLVYLPAEELLPGGRQRLGKLCRHSAQDPLGAFARPFLDNLASSNAELEGIDGGCVRRILVELARGLLAKQHELITPAEMGLPPVKVRDYIEAHLGNPMLSPSAIARGCNITIRQLHRMFAKTNWTACEWIRDQRLQRCYDALNDIGHSHQSITEIAFRWGFNDSAHFSRVFRQAYDRTPTDLRREFRLAQPIGAAN